MTHLRTRWFSIALSVTASLKKAFQRRTWCRRFGGGASGREGRGSRAKEEREKNAPVPRGFVPEAVKFGRSASITGRGGARARSRGRSARKRHASATLLHAVRSDAAALACSARRDASRVSLIGNRAPFCRTRETLGAWTWGDRWRTRARARARARAWARAQPRAPRGTSRRGRRSR